jgi:hypothetical protein
MFEGYLRHMYLDNRGLVTTGVGDLIEPNPLPPEGDSRRYAMAKQYRWVHIAAGGGDGAPASDDEIEAEFDAIKAKQEWKNYGGGYYGRMATLQMPVDEMDRKFLPKLERFEATMKATPGGFFADYENFPADAQLAILSLIWANGPANMQKPGHWPRFCALCKDRNWQEILTRKEYRWSNISRDREQAMIRVLTNAANLESANAQGFNFDITRVYYPGIVLSVQTISADSDDSP